MLIHIIKILHNLTTTPPGHEIYNFDRPFLSHPHYMLSLSDLCPGVEKSFLKKRNTTILHILPKTYPPFG